MSRGDLKIGGYTVAQVPNAPIVIAVVAAIVSRIADDGSQLWASSRAVFYVTLTIWAWMELSDGVDGFRRAIGAFGLAFVLVSIYQSLD
ncbi:MAG: hypothetical protein ACSLFD_12340 [Solirubrobacterales bacterium]